MIKYLVIDDEHIAHDIIKGYCDMLPHMEWKKSCYDAIEAMDYLAHHAVDLIFLDLNMPKLKGFDFLKVLKHPPKVIVTTAYSEYALEGYELNVVDYLLKPFSFERFVTAVNKAMDEKVPISSPPPRETHTIFLRSDKKYIQVGIDHILYLESAGNYVKVVTNSETVITRDKISELLKTLPENDFVRVHKSFAVAKRHISAIEGNRIFIGQYVVPIGKMYKLNVDRLVG